MHENPCSWSGVVTCRGTDGPSDTTKLIVTVWNFVNAPKNPCSVPKEDRVSRLSMDLYRAKPSNFDCPNKLQIPIKLDDDECLTTRIIFCKHFPHLPSYA